MWAFAISGSLALTSAGQGSVLVGRGVRGLWTKNVTHFKLRGEMLGRRTRGKSVADLTRRSLTRTVGAEVAAVVSDIHSVEADDTLLSHTGAVIAVYPYHDASIAVSIDGRVQCILELERLFEIRYYMPGELFQEHWLEALEAVRERCVCDTGTCPQRFDYGVVVGYGDNMPAKLIEIPLLVAKVFVVERWRAVDHHESHALLGFHASPFRSALVVSYDGGGNDGYFEVFIGVGQSLKRVAKLEHNFGLAYAVLGQWLPEVWRHSALENSSCASLSMEDGSHFSWNDLAVATGYVRPSAFGGIPDLSIAGKLMGYAATGALVPEISSAVRGLLLNLTVDTFRPAVQWTQQVPAMIFPGLCRSVELQRAFAASVQAEFQELVLGILRKLLERLQVADKVEGIVLTGGCALNVLTNQLVYETLTARGSSQHGWQSLHDLYVPPSPNDGGLTVGAIFAVTPPLKRQALQYLGFRLWDEHLLEEEARARGAQNLTSLGGVKYLAKLLAGVSDVAPSSHRPIVAVVRGRQEFGPRALGHRSLLAVPDSDLMRERMNRLKFREWYRPVAPMIADEALETVFGQSVKSPAMTMAPRVVESVRERFPAMVHLDGTARHQSVGKEDEPWLHALLLAVGELTGLAALINTSFNSRGKPIVNTVSSSLQMLDELAELEYVVIEDWLFSKRQKGMQALHGGTFTCVATKPAVLGLAM